MDSTPDVQAKGTIALVEHIQRRRCNPFKVNIPMRGRRLILWRLRYIYKDPDRAITHHNAILQPYDPRTMSLVSVTQKTTTVSKTVISQEQSQKLIHTMLTMSVGCLAFLRGLFADDNFIDQRFVPRKFEKNYNPDDPLMRSDSIRVKTLARGKSPQVDTFLDWIDKGVCDAIRKNYLEGLVLAIFLDENKPEDLHEVYTFSFDYKDNKVKLEMNSEQTETITLLDARQALQHLMRRFIIITQGLNPLPDKKFVTMRLLFNDSCPKKYQPECFKDASDRPVAMIKTKKSSLESYSAGIVSTGRHEVQLKVISSSIDKEDIDEETIRVDPFAIPRVPKVPVFKAPTMANKPKITTSTQDASQTTMILRGFLKDSQSSINPTQAMNRFICECGCSEKPNGHILPTVKCGSCGSMVHRVCYSLAVKDDLPMCFSCRSKNLGGLALHDNLRMLMLLRVWIKLSSTLKFTISLKTIHRELGLPDKDESLTVQVISFLLKAKVLIFAPEGSKGKFKSSELRVDFDIDGVEYRSKIVEKGIYQMMFSQRLHPFRSNARFSEIHENYRRWKVFLVETTKGKGICIDEELGKLSWDTCASQINGVVHDSSDDEHDQTEDVNLQFSSMNIESSQEPIVSSSLKPVQAKRARDSIESVEDDSAPNELQFYTSNPVTDSPRWKKRKTSVTKHFVDSTIAE